MSLDNTAQPSSGNLTVLLNRAGQGDRAALDELLPLVYNELRRVARHKMAGERPGHTLGVSGLVNEAYLKLIGGENPDWRSREHFFSLAARAMRQVLIDYARKRGAAKRDHEHTTMVDVADMDLHLEDLLALDQALERLAQIDNRMRRVVEYRFFCGLTDQETAALLGVTERTVQREWIKARAWLYEELYAEKRQP